MTFTIDLTPDEEARLVFAAKRKGIEPGEFLMQLVTDLLPESAEMTFAAILAPVHAYSREQGETEEEIGAFVDDEVAAFRAERRAKQKLVSHG